MLRLRLVVLATIGLFLALKGHAIAQQNIAQQSEGGLREQDLLIVPRSTQDDRNNPSTLEAREEQFLNSFAQDQLLEVAAAQLAVQRAEDPQIAQYALQLLNEHAQYNPQLLQLARIKGATLPVDLNRDGRATLERLIQLQGEAFDQAYLKQTIAANDSNINDLQQAAQTTEDSDVQAFIAQFLPLQQQHLQLAATLESNDNGNGNGSSDGGSNR